MKIKKVRKNTLKKVLKVIKNSKHALSISSISYQLNTNYDSAAAAIKVLVAEGKVRKLSTSAGLFYCSGDAKC